MKKIIRCLYGKVLFPFKNFFRRVQFYSAVRRRDKLYQKNPLNREEQIQRIQAHLAERRKRREILRILPERPRLFIAVKQVNWEKAGLVDSWREIAEVVEFDWGDTFDQYDPGWYDSGKKSFNEELYERVRAAHNEKNVDIFFSYLSGRWLFTETITRIKALGIITINFGFDDTVLFRGKKEHGSYEGNAEISPYFDICVTSSNPKDTGQYIDVGANPIFISSGGNEKVFGSVRPVEDKQYVVSFIGQKYGERGKLIEYLEKNSVHVHTWGIGWADGSVSLETMLKIYSQSLITIGFGYIGNTRIVGLKGRDFEVPMTGCCYLTTYHSELGNYLIEDKEIVFFSSKEELLRKVKYLIDHPEISKDIGLAAREKALSFHKWSDRWKDLLDICR